MTYPRTALAIGLVLVAVALPTGALFLRGGDQLGREAELERQTLQSYAYKKGVVLAERLSHRLAALRDDENDRPFYHYQNVYIDPKGVASGLSISPLGDGAANPYVWSHFQIDQDGWTTLPSADGIDGLPMSSPVCPVRDQLQDVAHFALQGYDPATRCPVRILEDPLAEADSGLTAEGGDPMDIRDVVQFELVDWRRHLELNGLSDVGGRPGVQVTPPGGRKDRVFVLVSDLEWYTLPVNGEPGLVALRTVDTPQGAWTQGFVVDLEAVDDYLKASHHPARFAPFDRATRDEAGTIALGVDGTPWSVVLDLAAALSEKEVEASTARADFSRFVFWCALGASLAGLLVIALVHQSERLAAQRAQFAASAAHELRTPIAGLRLYSEMLAEGLGDPTQARKYASRLAGESERLGRVVTNVLSFTRLERRMLSVDPREGALGPVVEEACARHRQTLEGAGVELRLDLPEDLPLARFDGDAVGQIVQNLLDNAEKHTRDVADRCFEVRLEARPKHIALVVADNGPGIPRSIRRRLFRAFARGPQTANAEGLGLGLVLVRALANAQGGSVAYSDSPGGGATFTVLLPRRRGSQATVSAAPTPATSP